MPWTEPVIPCDAPIAPRDPTDTFPSHIANYGRGGLHTVADTTERDAIPSGRLVVGMKVVTTDDGTTYRLTSADPVTWVAEAGTGSSGFYGGSW